MSVPEFSIVVPVYNEAENIGPLLRGIEAGVRGDCEILVVYDFEGDTTLPAIRALDPPVGRLRLVKNDLGKGVVNAIRAGFAASQGWLGVVVTMADLSDPPECIDQLVAKLREGNDVVAGSRYMRGGRQIGGPWLKGTLSRLAGTLAYLLTGIGIHDVTTNFRAYSRRLLQSIPIESAGGFELGLELTVKCHLRGWGVAEVPASWHDRSAGQSRFQLLRWLPGYLRWYLRLLTRDPLGLSPSIRQARRSRPRPASYQFFGVYERVDYGWTLQRFRPGTVIVPVTSDGRLVLIRVHRPHHADGQSDWEFPGGGGELGESSLDAGRRELREETGFATNDAGLVLADGLELVPGMGSYPHHVVLFRECKADGGFVPGHGEGIVDVATFSAGEVAELIRTGQIRSLPTVAGFWYFQQYRRPDC